MEKITVVSTKGKRKWQGIPGIEITKAGKLAVTFYSGGKKEPDTKNHIMLCESLDAGKTWSEPDIIAECGNKHTRLFDPTLWHDPKGRLWLIYNQGSKKLKDHTIWAIICDDFDAATPVWSAPVKIDIDATYAFRMNKPVVLSNGDWVLPITWGKVPTKDWLGNRDNLQGVAISSDEGLTWSLHGEVIAPRWALENMVEERKDGTLWMLIRTGKDVMGNGVIWESVSKDQGKTWSEGEPTEIMCPATRFYIRRLASGRLVLVNNFHPRTRQYMGVALSDDEGSTFSEPLIFDPRGSVSYPDAVEDEKGNIHIIYDRERGKIGEINYICLSEEEILTSAKED